MTAQCKGMSLDIVSILTYCYKRKRDKESRLPQNELRQFCAAITYFNNNLTLPK